LQKGQLGLVHGGHPPPAERAVQRVAGAFALQDGDELCAALPEAAEDGIGELAIHFDVAFAGKRVVAADVSRRTLFPGDKLA